MPAIPLSRVLCVEDDDDAAAMLSLLLKSHGIDVTRTRSAEEAWLILRVEGFDLLVLDVWLPRLGGLELCRELREFGCCTPILFYTGAGGEADMQKAIEVGANGYVIKPDIQGLIDSALDLIAKARTGEVAVSWASEEHYAGRKAPSVRSSRNETLPDRSSPE